MRTQWSSLKKSIAKLVLRLIEPKHRHDPGDLDVDKKSFLFVQLYYDVLGRFYYYYKRSQEYVRIYSYKLHRGVSQTKIAYEVVLHSRTTIVLIFLFLAATFLLIDKTNFSSLTQDGIKQILAIYSGGLIALLGIIFALYSVGFQTSTEKYSSDVTDYLNNEEVARFLFKLMTFASLFSLVNLIFQSIYTKPIIFLFLISTLFTTVSLLAILIFKDDYITKLKPKQVFKRLYGDSLIILKSVNAHNNPSIKSFCLERRDNVKSFKLYIPATSSWSLVGHMQKSFSEYLDIAFTLFEDLIADGKKEDATFGVISLGHLFAEYLNCKHFINRKFGWWFPEKDELVRSDNPYNLPLKLNYEAQGIGRFSTKVKNDNWVEDKILNFLRRVQKNTDFRDSPIIGNALINAYEVILCGSFSKTAKGYERDLSGAIGSQYHELSVEVFQQFVELGNHLIGINDCSANFVNALVRIKTSMLDGFRTRQYPGVANDWKPHFEERLNSLLDNDLLTVTNADVTSWGLPNYMHSVFTDLVDKLESESLIEGKILTAKDWLIPEYVKKVGDNEKRIIADFVSKLIPSLIELSESEDPLFKNYLGGIVLSIFNQLMDQNGWVHINEIIKTYKKELLVLFLKVDTNEFIDSELRDQIDHGTFSSLVKREKDIYHFYLGLFSIAHSHLVATMDKSDNHSVLKTLRRPLMLGGLAYIVSELDQDLYYVKNFTRQVEYISGVSKIEEYYEQLVEFMKKGDITYFNVVLEEANRYRGFYRRVINSISKLPTAYITRGSVPYGLSSMETVEHPSQFIQRMASSRLSDMDECAQGYVDWLKKRRQIIELIELLKNIIHAK